MFSIFFDIASAFDKVWHNGLIFKLINLNVPFYLVQWLINFLDNRLFCIKVNLFITKNFEIRCGVPQGAVLSPTLFSVFINDVPLNLKRSQSGSMLFADDLVFYQIYNKASVNLNNKINKHLASIESWLNKWRLKMAPQKCNYIVFSNGVKDDSSLVKVKLYNQVLSPCSYPKFLGIRFDKHLTFKNQISYLKETCIKRLNILKVLVHKSWHLSHETLMQIYTSLMRSILEYSSILLPTLSYTNMNTLQTIQNSAIRLIFRKKYDTKITDLHEIAKVPMLYERFDTLTKRYIVSSILNHNPLICSLRDEFLSFIGGGRSIIKKTLFCNFKHLF